MQQEKIIGAHGVSGIFKGTNVTLIREVFTYGMYFWSYESAVRMLLKPGQNRKDLGSGKLMLAGALAGYGYWIFGYPVDLIKTKIQTDSFTNPQYKSIVHCISETYRQGGVGGFFKGFTPCMLRAGPVNAGCFLVYENVVSYLSKHY